LIRSLNFTLAMSFGNWFCPATRRHVFRAPSRALECGGRIIGICAKACEAVAAAATVPAAAMNSRRPPDAPVGPGGASDAGLLAHCALDDAPGLTTMAAEILAGACTGRNGRHALAGLSWQSVFGRLARDTRTLTAPSACGMLPRCAGRLVFHRLGARIS
jgi:hypothetical protein